MKIAPLFIVLLLAGCATQGGTNMSPEQLAELVRDKNFSAVCSTVTGMGGQGKFVYVNIDKSVVTNGGIVVAPDCTMTMTNVPTPPKPKE
jgi:ABC-type Fe3+-hydroxamate transport system substrate-binding protein